MLRYDEDNSLSILARNYISELIMKNYKLGLILFLLLTSIATLFPPFEWYYNLSTNKEKYFFKKYDFLFSNSIRLMPYQDYNYEEKVYQGEKLKADTSDAFEISIKTGIDTTYVEDLSKKDVVRVGKFEFILYGRKIDTIRPYKIFIMKKPYWYNLRRELIVSEIFLEYFFILSLSLLIRILSLKRKGLSV